MLKYFRPIIRSRHPSHDALRKNKLLPLYDFKSVIRFGSLTDIKDTITNGGSRIEINTINSIKNSSDKLKMKELFSLNKINQARWFIIKENNNFYEVVNSNNKLAYKQISKNDLPFPIIVKNRWGSRGTGNTKLDNLDSLNNFLNNKADKLKNYIFEKYYSYNREYRLHVTENGYFYTCRKVLKNNTAENKRWFRNNENSNWLLEENEKFDKPINWNDIVNNSIKSLKAVGLDVGAVDIKIQSAKDKNDNIRNNPKFIILEINSAPSFGEITLQKYISEIPKILINKKLKLQE